ncbi:MAG TPA: hypothetical protein VLB85_14705 [Acidimicrobiia bacterium]|nr:hypothetical protein [Acidimicrobiia bacterium]
MVRSNRPEDRSPPVPGELVELRVHGVGGASPEDLLDVPLTELVAGDESAGFFRPWIDRIPSRFAREGYSWGGLTSAARLRALWVLLAPFALANLAGWMLRHGGEAARAEPRRRSGLESAAAAVIRLYGLVLSVTVAAYVASGAIDLISFQCANSGTCLQDRWWLAPWNNGLVSGHQGRLLVVGAGVATAALLAVAWMARQSQLAIHRRRDFAGDGDPAFTLNFRHRSLWDAPHIAHRLGLIHSAAVLTAVALTVATPSTGGGGWPATLGTALLVLAGLATLRLEGVSSRWHMALLILSAGHLALVMGASWGMTTIAAAGGPLPGADRLGAVLLPAFPLLALLAGGLAIRLWSHQRLTGLRAVLVAPALLLVAAGMVHAFGSGLTIRLADLLGRAAPSGGPSAIVYGEMVGDVAVLTVFALLVLAAATALAWWRAGKGPDCDAVGRRYADRGGLDCSDPADQEWAARVGRAQALATVTDRVALVLAATTFVVIVAAFLAVATGGDAFGLRLGRWGDRWAGPASWVLGFLPVAAVIAIARLYRSRAVRRTVGVVWDVATFWPRWFHPWSPPSYAEAAVPQLGARLELLTERGQVVLSGHSQGSAVAVATLASAAPRVASRVALLTHGSPLRRLYARYFPEYVSAGLLAGIASTAPGWINLWRVTDFIGGSLGAEGVEDVEVFDPPSSRPPAPGEPRPLPRRHSGYDRTDDYRAALDRLAQRLDR